MLLEASHIQSWRDWGTQKCSRGTAVEKSCWIYSRQRGPKSHVNRKPPFPLRFSYTHSERWPSSMSANLWRGRSRLGDTVVSQSLMICYKGVIRTPRGTGVVSHWKRYSPQLLMSEKLLFVYEVGRLNGCSQVNRMQGLLYQFRGRHAVCDRVAILCYEKLMKIFCHKCYFWIQDIFLNLRMFGKLSQRTDIWWETMLCCHLWNLFPSVLQLPLTVTNSQPQKILFI